MFTPIKLGYSMNTNFPFIVFLKCLLAKDFFQLYVKNVSLFGTIGFGYVLDDLLMNRCVDIN